MMDLADLKTHATSKRRLIIIAILCIVVLGVVYGTDKLRVAVAPAVPALSAPPVIVDKPVMPRGYQLKSSLHDPFALPAADTAAGIAKLTSATLPTAKPAKATKATSKQRPVLTLTGVVCSGSQRTAIIKYGQDSRSYQVGDRIGTYQLQQITDNSAVLAGPGGELMLVVGG